MTTEAGASVEQRVRKGRRYNFHKILLRFSQFFTPFPTIFPCTRRRLFAYGGLNASGFACKTMTYIL